MSRFFNLLRLQMTEIPVKEVLVISLLLFLTRSVLQQTALVYVFFIGLIPLQWMLFRSVVLFLFQDWRALRLIPLNVAEQVAYLILAHIVFIAVVIVQEKILSLYVPSNVWLLIFLFGLGVDLVSFGVSYRKM